MKEKILEAFCNLGFKLEEEGGVAYTFKYETLNLLYMYNESDENFLSIALPGIYEFEGNNTLQICALLEKINSSMKYIKAYIYGSSVWLFYERELFEEDDLMKIIPHMIFHLDAGLSFARKAMAEIEKSVADNSADENDPEDIDAEDVETEELFDNGVAEKQED